MNPAPASTPRLRVALEGFSGFERNALASYFRLAGDRFPAYEQADDLHAARFIVADADHPEAVQRVLDAGRVADTVFIGSHAPEGALGWMMRPIDPLHVLRELDAQVALQHPPRHRAPFARRATDVPLPSREVSPDALVVDDDEIAQRALERQLTGLGLSVARASSAAKAMELSGRLAFRYVFVDSGLDGEGAADPADLARRLKQQARDGGASEAPAVFVLQEAGTDGHAAAEGVDGWLPKPVDEPSLKRLVSARLAERGALRPLPAGSFLR
jgi:CheY-like chemotaxis protein